jgi:CspA family cold shock protein
MTTGKIKKLVSDKGFGFITPGPGKPDVFFHVSALADKAAFASLQEGQEIEFEHEKSDRGLRAVQVQVPATTPPAVS